MDAERAAAAMQKLGRESQRTGIRLLRLQAAIDGAYLAEVAAAHFGGRVPPSREVWYAEHGNTHP